MKCQHCLKIFGVLAIIRKNSDSSDYLKLCFPCSEIWIIIFFSGKSYNIAYEEMKAE